ncbi:MAG: ribulose-phosphate 3-epimerase [Candidatus Dormibacteraeota bacterium]|nr:ribulose-phosphate 3-epimerase [Candidatus Dormibacteraeota bacterium]
MSPSGGRVEVVPSILSADLTRLGEQVEEAVGGGADRIQVDVMDGHFVPNLTFGPDTVKAVRRAAPSIPIEAHLMIERPEQWIEEFVHAGADWVIPHVEAMSAAHRTLVAIKEAGGHPGVALRPGTPPEAVSELVPLVEMLLCMTVEPGFGGQAFIPQSPGKLRRLRALAPDLPIEVDGGIDVRTTPAVVEAGATLLVAGSSVYAHRGGVAAGIKELRDAAG